MLILGGAFLLRAATETALNHQIGIALGLAYAIAWIVAAAFAAKKGRRNTRHLPHRRSSRPSATRSSPRRSRVSTSSALLPRRSYLAAFSLAMLIVARLYDLQTAAWIAVAGATIVALVLALFDQRVDPVRGSQLTFAGVAAFVLLAELRRLAAGDRERSLRDLFGRRRSAR